MIDNNLNIIIFILMICTGFIFYFLYMKNIDNFDTSTQPETTTTQPETTTTQPETTTTQGETTTTQGETTTTQGETTPTSTQLDIDNLCNSKVTITYKSIMSRYFGVGFNIEYIENKDAYLINHIPTTSSGTLQGNYAVSNDNMLTIRLKNSIDYTQLWKIIEKTDTISKYYIVQPFEKDNFALQYENGNLALRQYNLNNNFENQKWMLNNTKITRGIPVLNYSPGSLFTTEFDPYSTPNTYSNNITEQNSQQINDVISNIKTGVQQYLGQLDNKYQTEQVTSSSSLGHQDTPLNINLNLNSTKDSFTNLNNNNNNNNDNNNNIKDINYLYTNTNNIPLPRQQNTSINKKFNLEEQSYDYKSYFYI